MHLEQQIKRSNRCDETYTPHLRGHLADARFLFSKLPLLLRGLGGDSTQLLFLRKPPALCLRSLRSLTLPPQLLLALTLHAGSLLSLLGTPLQLSKVPRLLLLLLTELCLVRLCCLLCQLGCDGLLLAPLPQDLLLQLLRL